MEIKENDLVMLRLNNGLPEDKQRHYNTWLRVLFIDTDKTFIGKVELTTRDGQFIAHKKGDTVKYPLDKIVSKYQDNDGNQWCYKDEVTRCKCPGLCRNSM
jgi:hypothetical protein